VIELRNIELRHSVSDQWSITGGVISLLGDARSLVFNDHIGAVQASYKTDVAAYNFWYGEASNPRPAVSASYARDVYWGANAEWTCSEKYKTSLYLINRDLTDEDMDAESEADGAGLALGMGTVAEEKARQQSLPALEKAPA
jgi:hypothetical protein